MIQPQKYRKKPVAVEAIQYHGGNADTIVEWGFQAGIRHAFDGSHKLVIPTLEGDMTVDLGDYVIKGVQGEFYPCKPNIFEQTYEKP